MKKLFNWDSPIFQLFNKLADFMVLNLLLILCSIPIFTIGAAQTALYDVVGRIIRQEEQVWKDYWRAFRSNFKQATILWLILLLVGIVSAFALWFYMSVQTIVGTIAMVLVGIVLILCLGTLTWVFALQSRFENPVKMTLRNAVYCAISYLPRTIIMASVNVVPLVLCFVSLEWFVRLGVFWFFLWFALAAYWNMQLLKKPFAVMEGISDKREQEHPEVE